MWRTRFLIIIYRDMDEDIVAELDLFLKTPLDQVIHHSDEGRRWTCDSSSSSLASLVQSFGKYGLHSLLVCIEDAGE